MSVQLDEHRQLLADRKRVDALSRAIASIVAPGDTVLDVASGTGVLGLLACRAGASRVYCIE
jgi:predicted RNA methylase